MDTEYAVIDRKQNPSHYDLWPHYDIFLQTNSKASRKSTLDDIQNGGCKSPYIPITARVNAVRGFCEKRHERFRVPGDDALLVHDCHVEALFEFAEFPPLREFPECARFFTFARSEKIDRRFRAHFENQRRWAFFHAIEFVAVCCYCPTHLMLLLSRFSRIYRDYRVHCAAHARSGFSVAHGCRLRIFTPNKNIYTYRMK